MLQTIELENVPEDLATQLALRAFRNGRSMSDEVLAILAAALQPAPRKSLAEIAAAARALGISSPSESVAIIRADRSRNG